MHKFRFSSAGEFKKYTRRHFGHQVTRDWCLDRKNIYVYPVASILEQTKAVFPLSDKIHGCISSSDAEQNKQFR